MKLVCNHTMVAHWGVIFEFGKEYDVELKDLSVWVVTDAEKYYEIDEKIFSLTKDRISARLSDGSIAPISRKPIEILEKELSMYRIKLNLKHASIKSEQNTIYDFLLETDEEISELLTDVNKGKIKLDAARIDNHFDYKAERRNSIINKILK